jgi:hypothetical protein
MASPPRDRYVAARTCLERLTKRGAALPLGRFRAPKSGWIVLRGRRGHYVFCDELRAYDLATGAAFVARECSGLEFGGDGFVDEKTTEARKKPETVAGRVPIDALRELALMMLLSPSVQDQVVLSASWYDLPGTVVPRRPKEETIGPPERPGGWRSSAQTRLAWSWNVPGSKDGAPPTIRSIRASGAFSWPAAAEAADDYVAHLVTAVESSLEPGCVPVHAPADLLIMSGARPGVSPIDASEQVLDASTQRLATALGRLRGAPLCAGPARP